MWLVFLSDMLELVVFLATTQRYNEILVLQCIHFKVVGSLIYYIPLSSCKTTEWLLFRVLSSLFGHLHFISFKIFRNTYFYDCEKENFIYYL